MNQFYRKRIFRAGIIVSVASFVAVLSLCVYVCVCVCVCVCVHVCMCVGVRVGVWGCEFLIAAI